MYVFNMQFLPKSGWLNKDSPIEGRLGLRSLGIVPSHLAVWCCGKLVLLSKLYNWHPSLLGFAFVLGRHALCLFQFYEEECSGAGPYWLDNHSMFCLVPVYAFLCIFSYIYNGFIPFLIPKKQFATTNGAPRIDPRCIDSDCTGFDKDVLT